MSAMGSSSGVPILSDLGFRSSVTVFFPKKKSVSAEALVSALKGRERTGEEQAPKGRRARRTPSLLPQRLREAAGLCSEPEARGAGQCLSPGLPGTEKPAALPSPEDRCRVGAYRSVGTGAAGGSGVLGTVTELDRGKIDPNEDRFLTGMKT